MKKSLRLKSNNYRIVYISLALTIFVFTVSALYLSTEKAKKRENFWVATKSIPFGQLIKESDVERNGFCGDPKILRSEEHTSELQSH